MRGTLECLAPVLMTALAAALGPLPITLSVGQLGKELLQPIAVVILGALLSRTLLDQMVTPALFFLIGKREFAGAQTTEGGRTEATSPSSAERSVSETPSGWAPFPFAK